MNREPHNHEVKRSAQGSPASGVSVKKGGLNAGLVLILSCVLLGAAVGITWLLINLKKPPTQAEILELRHQVEVTKVAPEEVPVIIAGYGEAKSLHVIQIIPEVPGKVVQIHDRLLAGEVISKGELLFQIDPRNYIASRDQARAQVEQTEKSIERLKKQFSIDKERLVTLRRSRELAQNELNRLRTLLSKDDVGTQSGVDQAEMAYNQTNDLCDQLEQAVDLYPLRIQEAESGLSAAKAQLSLAATNLERTDFYAPFNARIKQRALEVGQYVAPGAPVLTIADDSTLEISVPLDSRDARSWLRFSEGGNFDENSWFGGVEQVRCRISWTEDTGAHFWEGSLNRVERFDQTTRTVTVAIRISGEDARSSGGGLPLVDGMFCQVEIPGKTMQEVYRLPRWAVSFEGQVFLAKKGAQALFLPKIEDAKKLAKIKAELSELLKESAEEEMDTPGGLAEYRWRKALRYLETIKDAQKADSMLGKETGLKPWRAAGQWPEAMEAALNKGDGELSDLIPGEGGFYILRSQHRLKRQDVVVARSQSEESFVQEGLTPGDLVVVTRLVNPMPNSLLTVIETDKAQDAPNTDQAVGNES